MIACVSQRSFETLLAARLTLVSTGYAQLVLISYLSARARMLAWFDYYVVATQRT